MEKKLSDTINRSNFRWGRKIVWINWINCFDKTFWDLYCLTLYCATEVSFSTYKTHDFMVLGIISVRWNKNKSQFLVLE